MHKSDALTDFQIAVAYPNEKNRLDQCATTGPAALFSRSGADSLNCWSRLDDRARMVLARDRSLLWSCTKAAILFGPRRELRLDGDKVSAANPDDTRQLDRLLAVGAGEVRFHAIPMVCGSGHLVLGAAPLDASRGQPKVGLTVRCAHPDFQCEWPDFTEIFGFTAGEDRVVRMLFSGLTPQLVAHNLGLSIDTVRTHIRHAYEKLGISHREELWARLAPYRLN